MTTITLWLLIAAGSNNTSPTNISQLQLRDCLTAAATMQRLARDKPGIAHLYGICVEAKVVK